MKLEGLLLPARESSEVIFIGGGDNVQSFLVTKRPDLMTDVIRSDERQWAYQVSELGVRYWMPEQFDDGLPLDIHPSDIGRIICISNTRFGRGVMTLN
jgi:hypothetical protein